MSTFNPFLWHNRPGTWSYGVAVLSVAAVVIIARWPALHLQDAPVSLFLCAVILSAWLGGVWPGLLATLLSIVAFYYTFLPPVYSFEAKPAQIARLALFTMSAFFVGSLSVAQRSATESLRRARDDLKLKIDELRQAEDRTRLIIDTVPAQLWTETPEGVVDFVNRRWVEYTGMTPEEAVGSGWTRVIHPDDIKRVLNTRRAFIAEGKPREIELRLRRFDGQYRWFLSRGRPLVDRSGHILAWYCSLTDIHARREAEETLRRNEAYLAEAQRLSETGSWAWSPATGDIRYWSEECYRVLGFDPIGPPPRFETFFERIHTDDQAASREGFERAIRDKADFEMDYRIVHAGGQVRDIHVIGHPVLGASGDIVEFVGTVMDVTARKQAEAERERLRQAQAELARVNRITTMGELTASLAHELNQPIGAAVINANTCIRWLAGDNPNIEEARAAAMRSAKDGRRAAEIITRIRLLFKKGNAEREPVDVNEVIREMIVLLHGETTLYDILVETDLAQELPPVLADRVQLQQVMMNLIMNSIDAMKDVEGNRALTVKSERNDDGQTLITVSDTGVGLPPEQKDQIFNAFFTTKSHGTGMGLSISRSIVESHGGRLWATGNSPRGATFCLALPANIEADE